MAPLIIEGTTLGEKHRSFNKIVNEAKKNKSNQEIADIDYEESDLDNLFKIYLASNNRNVEYILKILKSTDMFYISRAIKQSLWLIIEPQYAHVVNPNFLHNELFPEMTSKAIKKFLLKIRLNLKDEKRLEEFFNYYKEEDLQFAFKWIPFCSPEFIENIIKEHADDIPTQLLVRLCENSITYLEIFFQNSKSYYKYDVISKTMFLLKNNAEKYLNIVEANLSRNNHWFRPKFTKLIMIKCGDRIFKNFELYADTVHIPTFATFIKKDDVKNFILKHIKNPKLKHLFTCDSIKPFLNRLPCEDRFQVVKDIFIDKKYSESSQSDVGEDESVYGDAVVAYCSSAIRKPKENVYSWYIYAQFSVAIVNLKKMIQKESSSSERLGMLKVLLSCTKNNMQDIQTLLKFYRENHINEPFKFKIQFVNLVISKTKTHEFDKVTWGYLNDLFVSMDVYTESENVDIIQSCVKSIILHSVIQNESIPKIIEKKFLFETCKKHQKFMSKEDSDKVFSYLFKYLTTKIDHDIKEYKQFTKTIDILENILRLLLDWNRELQDFPQILQKLKNMVLIKQMKSWDYDISKCYDIKKSWKKLLFAESVLLNPSQDTCINALKHDPELLEICKPEVELICLSKNIHVDQFLKKLRIYWPSLAAYYKGIFIKNFDQIINHKASVVGLCTLLHQSDLKHLVTKYIPTEEKIDWSQHDEITLSLRKHIATSLHVARPQPSLTLALSYAKGDYVQYILPSLNAILYNMSCNYASDNLKQLLDAPVSLQKHGIRISTRKFKNKHLIKLFADIWKSNKNSSIRSILFCETFNILCKERDTVIIKLIWQLLSYFIDNLTLEENQNIYNKLSTVRKVPECIKGEFWIKCISFLKTLPASANCGHLIQELQNALPVVMEFIEDNFIVEMLLDSLDSKLSTGVYVGSKIAPRFIWLSKSDEVQLQRYNKVIVPILERSFALWDIKHKDQYYVRANLLRMCQWFGVLFEDIFLHKETNLPIAILTNIADKIQSNLPLQQNYSLILKIKLVATFNKILGNIVCTQKDFFKEIKQSAAEYHGRWQPLYERAAPEVGKECIKYLKDDVANIFPSIYNIFANVLLDVCRDFRFDRPATLAIDKAILEDKDFMEGHLLVIQLLRIQGNYYGDDDKLKTEILNELQKHPSKEVQIHYWHYWHEFQNHINDTYTYA